MTDRLRGPKKVGWPSVTPSKARRLIGKAVEADLYHTDATKTYYPNDCLSAFGLLLEVKPVKGRMALVLDGNMAVPLASVAAIRRLPMARHPFTHQMCFKVGRDLIAVEPTKDGPIEWLVGADHD